MSTTQRRGFRLPWTPEDRKPDPDESETARRLDAFLAPPRPPDAAKPGAIARRTGERSGQLGSGPFGLPRAAPLQTSSDVQAPAAVDDGPAAEVDDARSEPMASPNPGGADATAGPVAELEALRPPVPSPEPDAMPVPARAESPAPDATARSARRDNPLVAGLVKAMRDAARTARNDSVARHQAAAAARIAAIRERGAANVVELRRRSDTDVVGIRAWAKAEMARIHEETAQRIAGRRAQLARETQSQAGEAERQVDTIKEAVAAFEAEMEGFFEQLLAEEDPARVATLAEQVPEAPPFEPLPSVDSTGTGRSRGTHRTTSAQRKPRAPGARATRRRDSTTTAGDNDAVPSSAEGDAAARNEDDAAIPWQRIATQPEPEGATGSAQDDSGLAPDAAAAAEAEASAGLDLADRGFDWQVATLRAALSRLEAVPAATEAYQTEQAHAPADAELGEASERDAPSADEPIEPIEPFEPIEPIEPIEPFEPVASTAEEPAPATPVVPPDHPVEQVTRVRVTGLTSVAGISAFKGSLGRLPGVSAVSVTSGDQADFVFAVSHVGIADLRAALSSMHGFGANITADTGDDLSVLVDREPAA